MKGDPSTHLNITAIYTQNARLWKDNYEGTNLNAV